MSRGQSGLHCGGNKAGLPKEDLVQGHLYIQELPVSSTVLEEVTYVQPRTDIRVSTPLLVRWDV